MRFALGTLVLVFLLVGCGKERLNIPNVPVNFARPLSDPELIRLSSPGGAAIIKNHGVAGLVIYRTLSGGYRAYDRCSTVNPEQQCAVELDAPPFTVTDKCSGAKYMLEDGSPVKAPAVLSLKSYQVRATLNMIYVTN